MTPRPPPTAFTVDRPVAVLMVFLSAVIFGYFSFFRLPVTLMPELSYPTLTVRTEYPGAAPEEVENEISRPIEDALGVVGGLSRISSISRAGVSDVVLEFLWGTDMSQAMQGTLEKLDLVFLPREAERPLVLHFDPALDPVMELSFFGDGPRFAGEQGLRRLRRIAELQVRRALEPIKGIAAVRVRGGLEEEIHVLLDEDKLRRSSLSIQAVIDRLRQENINVAGGTIKEGPSEYMVRTLNEYEDLDQIADTIVQRFEDRDLRVRELGRVVRSHKEREIVTRTDGAESVQIDIYKEADANMVEVARRVIERLGSLQPQPDKPSRFSFGPRRERDEGLAIQLLRDEGARLEVVSDRSVFIQKSIGEVRDTAISGGLLAVAILFLFLWDVRTTVIIGLSIPMSLLITFAPMNLMGVSLNIMSLGGLALGVGMLVDNSIVVLESIFRCRQEGDSLRDAAIRGTAEVRDAVISSTLTTVAVFFPLVFVEGIAGQAFGDLAVAVVVSLLASLVVALGFLPMLASRGRFAPEPAAAGSSANWRQWIFLQEFRADWSRRRGVAGAFLTLYLPLRLLLGLAAETLGKLLATLLLLLGRSIRIIVAGFQRPGRTLLQPALRRIQSALERSQASYPRFIGWALDRPSLILGLMLVSFLATAAIGLRLETELLPEVHQREFTFEVSLPVGTPLEETIRALAKVEKAILADKTDIRSLLVTFGYDVTNMRRSDEGEHSARFKVLLMPGGDSIVAEERLLTRLRALFLDIPGADVRVARPVLFSSKPPVVLELEGDQLLDLRRMAQLVQARLATLQELSDVETTQRRGAPEIQISYDRDRLIRYGLNIGQVARLVRDMVKGFEATRFNLKDRRIPILVRLDEPDREQTEDIGRLTLNAGGPHPIPLSAVAELRLGEGPSEVRRIDGQRVALVQANLGAGSLGGAVRAIDRALAEGIVWPVGMRYLITGQNEEWERSQGSLYLALALSLFLVYVIMAAQFESLTQPMLIMLTVPMAFLGSALGLWLLGINISILVFLGMILLAGIVVNNAIILVDYTNTLRARGLDLRTALATAGAVRLRPILMTTATTVLGLLPMAFGLGDGSELRTPMAVTVISGLISSTVLTLVAVPTLYLVLEQARERWFPTRPRDEENPSAPPAAHLPEAPDPAA